MAAESDLPHDSPFGLREGDIVIPGRGLDTVQTDRVLSVLASMGIRYAIAGTSLPAAENDSRYGFNYLLDETEKWELAHGEYVDESYLEEVVIDDGQLTSRHFITARSIHTIFKEMLDDTVGTARSAGNFYNRLSRVIKKYRGQRAYLCLGTVSLGNLVKERNLDWNVRQWGITPAALYGITQETQNERRLGPVNTQNAIAMLRFLKVES